MIDSDRLRGFGNGQIDRGTYICDCRVAFATENFLSVIYGLFTQNFAKQPNIFYVPKVQITLNY